MPIDALIQRIDDRLAEMGKSRRWLCLEIGRGQTYIRDLARGKSLRLPRSDDLARIAIALETSVGYLLNGDLTNFARTTPPPSPIMPPVNRELVIRAESIAQAALARLGESYNTPETRARIIVALYAALTQAEQISQPIDERLLPTIVTLIASLIGN